MNPTRKRSLLAAQRASERRIREDEAPRLREAFPGLVSLQIVVVEEANATTMTHRRHVVIANAPVLFLVSCGDKACEDGGHDITTDVMTSLAHAQSQSEGEHPCAGQVATVPCARRIRYTICAEYAQA
jgi:hypothetical protein